MGGLRDDIIVPNSEAAGKHFLSSLGSFGDDSPDQRRRTSFPQSFRSLPLQLRPVGNAEFGEQALGLGKSLVREINGFGRSA